MGRDGAAGRLLVALIALGALLRFATLSAQSFDLDESVTAALVHHSFAGMLSSIPRTESTPPLYDVLVWAWARLFGASEVGLRSLSALAGTAMVPLVYVTGKRLASRKVGLIAAGLTAVSPWLVWYSQEARAYALFALLGLASFACFVAAARSQSRRALAGWAGFSAAALATHYFAVFLVGPETLWLILRAGQRRRSLLAASPSLLVGAALVPLALAQSHEIEWRAGFLQTPLRSRIADIPTSFLVGEAAPGGSRIALSALAAALVAAGALCLLHELGRSGRRALRAGLGVTLSALLLPVLLALLGRDYLDARNLIAVWAPLTVVLAAGYAAMGRRGAIAAIALGALSLGLTLAVSSDTALQRTDYRGMAALLRASPPGQRVLVVTPEFNWTPFAYYLPGYPQLGSGRVGVREIDLIGWDTQALSRSARAGLERRGFRITGERTMQKLRLVTLIAPAARSLSRGELLRGALGHEHATVLIEEARHLSAWKT